MKWRGNEGIRPLVLLSVCNEHRQFRRHSLETLHESVMGSLFYTPFDSVNNLYLFHEEIYVYSLAETLLAVNFYTVIQIINCVKFHLIEKTSIAHLIEVITSISWDIELISCIKFLSK
jgi:hypothetical protein